MTSSILTHCISALSVILVCSSMCNTAHGGLLLASYTESRCDFVAQYHWTPTMASEALSTDRPGWFNQAIVGFVVPPQQPPHWNISAIGRHKIDCDDDDITGFLSVGPFGFAIVTQADLVAGVNIGPLEATRTHPTTGTPHIDLYTLTVSSNPGPALPATITITGQHVVPEPSALTIAGLAALGLIGHGWRRNRAERQK